MERTPATRITGYFENVVPNLSDSKLKKNRMRRNTFVADSFTRDYAQIIMMQRGKPLLANMSADATHRFQPFQPSSELVEKVRLTKPTGKGFFPIEHEKPQPKTVDPNRTRPLT